MKKIFLLALLSVYTLTFAQDREVEYIQKYALLAVQEMHLYKIPASITLAQGILETGGGQSRLAEQANNHFGIKCKKEWLGESLTHDDDAPGECFRKYNSVEDSYRDHSKFLAERPYYRRLFGLELTDYEGWAHGLKKAGYATNPRYAYILIDKIKKYSLDKFDYLNTEDDVYNQVVALYGPVDRKIVQPNFKEEEKVIVAIQEPKKENKEEPKVVTERIKENKDRERVEALAKKSEKKKRVERPVVLNQQRIRLHPIGRKYIIVNEGETIPQIAKAYNVRESRLLCYNDLDDAKDLSAGQYLFLEKKRYKGSKETYKVQEGDSMYSISQKMGIRLRSLYRKNRMERGTEPKVGEVLYLRSRKPRS
ncbi:glucosaminidase domain-containing protein [Weeksellaceae bacterium TAE3-ERU29]|nr:glucosaminidase domain-containing protein [Weeksellaceae bacterium TAE3-ERU29]